MCSNVLLNIMLFHYSMAPNKELAQMMAEIEQSWITSFKTSLSLYTHSEEMIWQLDNNTLQNLNSIVD